MSQIDFQFRFQFRDMVLQSVPFDGQLRRDLDEQIAGCLGLLGAGLVLLHISPPILGMCASAILVCMRMAFRRTEYIRPSREFRFEFAETFGTFSADASRCCFLTVWAVHRNISCIRVSVDSYENLSDSFFRFFDRDS